MSNEIELFSISAEQSVLGALMLDGDAMDHIGALSEGDFYREDHRRIFAAIRSLSAAGKVRVRPTRLTASPHMKR